MDVITEYIENVRSILSRVLNTQKQGLEACAQRLAQATLSGHSIFAFGCSHAGLLALEMYYRSGGMATINPVRAAGLCLDIDPATMTSQMERLPEYGRLIIDNLPLGKDDVILIHSVSGRNTVTVDAALRAREKGAYVIALTSMGSNPLREMADVVLTLTTRERLYSKVAGFTSELSIKLVLDTLYGCLYVRHADAFAQAKEQVSRHAEPGRTSDSAILREAGDA